MNPRSLISRIFQFDLTDGGPIFKKYEEIMFIGSCGAVCHAVFEFVRLVSRA
jgi:hypothetical protein